MAPLRSILPACCISLHIIQAVTDVISLGLATTVLPAAMPGAIFQVSRYRGRFQGLIRPAGNSSTVKGPVRGTLTSQVPRPGSLTYAHGAADGVVEAARVLHLTAVVGVVE